jgi:hypothetical protein
MNDSFRNRLLGGVWLALLLALLCGHSSAQVPTTVTLTIGSAQVATGQRVQLPLTLTTAATLTGLQGTLAWDPGVLRFVSATPSLNGLLVNDAAAIATGHLPLLWTNPAGGALALGANTPLLLVEFDAIGAAGTTAAIELNSAVTPLLVLDSAFAVLPMTLVPGAVQIGPGTTGFAENLTAATLRVWPNPAHTAVHVQGAHPRAALVLVDAVGRAVWHTEAALDGTAVLAVQALPAGLYVLRTGRATTRIAVE